MKNSHYRAILIAALILTPFLSVYREEGVAASGMVYAPQTEEGATLTQNAVLGASEAFSATTTAMLELTNKDREANGLPDLTMDGLLMTAAQDRAKFLCNRPFSHYSDGSTPWDSFAAVGYSYHYAGENLAKDYANPTMVEYAFMHSPEHKENIVNPNYTDYGVEWSCGITVVLFGSV